MRYVDPDGREDVSPVLRMGGYKLSSTQVFDYLVNAVEVAGLMGKSYSSSSNPPYVCTTFVEEAWALITSEGNDYLPGGQRVVDSVVQLSDLIESQGKNPSEGSYIFYFVDSNGKTGHTGFVNFDKDGNTKILHNGSDGKCNECVNLRVRDSRDFKTCFNKDNSGTLFYKKIEVEIWEE